jgi:hypothetical protein
MDLGLMARKQRPSQLTSVSLGRRMEFSGGSSGYLDPTTRPLPETELQRFFRDEKAVQAFSVPVAPRR